MSCSTAPVTFTGTATLRVGHDLRRELHDRRAAAPRGRARGRCRRPRCRDSPSGSITNPRSLPDARTSSAMRSTGWRRARRRSARPRVLANGFTASTSAPSLVSRFGITIDDGTERVVEHDLEPALLDAPVDVDDALERRGVELERTGREHDVADVAAERTAVVLAVRAAARSCAASPGRCRGPSRRRTGSRRCRDRRARAAR